MICQLKHIYNYFLYKHYISLALKGLKEFFSDISDSFHIIIIVFFYFFKQILKKY